MADHKRRGGQQQEKKDLTLDAGAVLEIIGRLGLSLRAVADCTQ
jgi:hypothetical protein